jgi:hypothetical protein
MKGDVKEEVLLYSHGMTNNETEEFWAERENQYGGEIRFRSFARLLGSTDRDQKDLSGLLYQSGETLVFEDFEKESALMGLIIKTSKKKYEKTVIEIPFNEISAVKPVTQTTAKGKLAGAPGETREISSLAAFLGRPVHELVLSTGERLYFEVLDKRSLKELLGL